MFFTVFSCSVFRSEASPMVVSIIYGIPQIKSFKRYTLCGSSSGSIVTV